MNKRARLSIEQFLFTLSVRRGVKIVNLLWLFSVSAEIYVCVRALFMFNQLIYCARIARGKFGFIAERDLF